MIRSRCLSWAAFLLARITEMAELTFDTVCLAPQSLSKPTNMRIGDLSAHLPAEVKQAQQLENLL